jgi:hypothetical protein
MEDTQSAPKHRSQRRNRVHTPRNARTNSDGSHFIAVERGPSIDGCTFSNTNGDAVNVHGFYVFVLEKTGARRYRISPKWDIGLVAGDEVESCEQASFRSLGRTKLMQLTKRKVPELKGKIAQLWKGKSPTTVPDLVYEIELQADLPLKTGDALTSLNRIGVGTTVRNCSFHACGRVMVKAPDSLIENNQFSYSCAVAVNAGSDIGFWAESEFAKASQSGTIASATAMWGRTTCSRPATRWERSMSA